MRLKRIRVIAEYEDTSGNITANEVFKAENGATSSISTFRFSRPIEIVWDGGKPGFISAGERSLLIEVKEPKEVLSDTNYMVFNARRDAGTKSSD